MMIVRIHELTYFISGKSIGAHPSTQHPAFSESLRQVEGGRSARSFPPIETISLCCLAAIRSGVQHDPSRTTQMFAARCQVDLEHGHSSTR